jgi:hypothetical protein
MNAPVLPKVRMKVDEFLAWSLNPPGMMVPVAALLGPPPGSGGA